MKIIHLNYSDIDGGAARAAYRIHESLRSLEINSLMWVNNNISGNWTVENKSTKFERFLNKIYPYLVKPIIKMLKTTNQTLHSPQIFSSKWVNKINNSDADLLHLHWTQNEMLSISDISQIKKPMIWTLHDMWVFCGAEHYTNDSRWKNGYKLCNRPSYESGFDINYWTWKRKRKNWKKPIQIICPSNWLSDCAKNSALLKQWPIQVIPYPIDTSFWKPLKKDHAKEFLGLNKDEHFILFGAVGGTSDPRKGFDLLKNSLKFIKKNQSIKNLKLIIFGQHKNKDFKELDLPVHFLGHIFDNFTLRALYSASDVMVVPSRLEAFGQTALEAQACGVPVVAFRTGGLNDIILHKQTGYLANAFDTNDLANGILWSLKSYNKNNDISNLARINAVENYSYELIASKYIEVYKKVILK